MQKGSIVFHTFMEHDTALFIPTDFPYTTESPL